MAAVKEDRMRVLRPYAAALAIAALALAFAVRPGGAQEGAGAAGGPRVPVVAVVDMSNVLAGSAEWRDLGKERALLAERARQTLTNLTQKVQVLRNEYESLPPGTDERTAKANELQAALQELQRSQQQFEQQIGQSYTSATRALFGKVSAVVADYAREHGIDLVLKKQTVDLSAPESLGQNIMLATTEVIYAEPGLDISQAVVERLNAEYSGPIEVK